MFFFVVIAHADSPLVNSEFRAYYKDFTKLAEQHHCLVHDNLLLVSFDEDKNFTAIGPKVVGVCYSIDEWRLVTIRKSYWETIGPFQRKVLVYHELGHCLLGRDHDSTLVDGFCPKSMMYPSVVDAGCAYLGQSYLQELFDTKACPNTEPVCATPTLDDIKK
jgi:hypothetical protein